MKRYQVEIARRAVRSIARLPPNDQIGVRTGIDLLATEPRPPRCVRIWSARTPFTGRASETPRIIYEVIDRRLVVQVVRVAHRRDVYRNR